MRENEKLFHSHIFRAYLDYLKRVEGWSDERLDRFLSDCGTDITRISDDSTWFDAQFADAFYERLVTITGDRDLAYKAGRFLSPQVQRPVIYHMLRGLTDVSFVYKLTTRLAEHFSKAAEYRIVSVGSNVAEIEVVPVQGFVERPYMCENRRGIFEAIPTVFGLKPALLREAECVHRNGKKCSYHLTWERRSQLIPLLKYSVLIATIFFSLQLIGGVMIGAAVSGIAALALTARELRRRFIEQRQELLSQNAVLDTTLRDVEKKNRQLQLINEISKMTHSFATPLQLAESLVRNVSSLLGYDRAVLLMVDQTRRVLKVFSFWGFDEHLKELLMNTEFNLNADNNAGFFIRVVNTKKPLLIANLESEMGSLSLRSQKFAKILGSKSFVAVPLTDEKNNVVGVLSADNVMTQKSLGISDQDLLATLGEQFGIALSNARLLGELEENLEKAKELSQHEARIAGVFKKFVPTDLAAGVAHANEFEIENRIKDVKKSACAILFLDIFRFTEISNRLAPEDVVRLLNVAFGIFEPCISSCHGFIDKFTGDGLMAVFEGRDAAVKACAAAVELVRRVAEVNAKLTELGFPETAVGLGLNFGQVILGNVGSENRLNFTVIGDAVNLASRLESHTRTLGPNTICVSSSVQARVKHEFNFKDLGQISLKGLPEPISAYQLLDGVSVSAQSATTKVP